jgi:hypothetical protein
MKHSGYQAAALGVCLIVVVFLLIKTVNLSSELQTANEKDNRTAADLQASVKRAEAELAKLKETASGLGEYIDNDTIARWQTLVCCEGFKLGAGRVRTG